MNTSELMIQPASTSRDTVVVGAIAGITAGLAMAFWAALTSIWHGVGLLSSFELIGATFMGSGAVGGGLGMIAYGLVVHTLMSAAFGILFTLLLPKDISCRQACAAGLAYGLAVMLAMTFVIAPIVNPVIREAVTLLPKSWLIQHALFGVSLGLVPLLLRHCADDGVRVRLERPAGSSLVVRPRHALTARVGPALSTVGGRAVANHADDHASGRVPRLGVKSARNGAIGSIARRALQRRGSLPLLESTS